MMDDVYMAHRYYSIQGNHNNYFKSIISEVCADEQTALQLFIEYMMMAPIWLEMVNPDGTVEHHYSNDDDQRVN